MKILYGVVGEGMGHAMRSRVVLEELRKRHEIQVVVSGRAYDYLQQRAGNVVTDDGPVAAQQQWTQLAMTAPPDSALHVALQ